MTAPTVFPANLQWLGIGKESTTYGTPPANPTVWVPLLDPKWVPHQTMLKDDSLRGDMAATHNQVQGVRYDTIDYKSYLYLDTLYPHMLNILGNPDTLTGSSDPWTHKTALLNTGNGQPTSWTLWLSNGAECWRMTGCQASDVSIDLPADGMATMSASWMGLPATNVTAPANTPTTLKPWASWNSTITIGGGAAAVYSSAKLDYKRETAPIHTADGTQAPYVIFMGPLTATGELTAVYQGFAGTPTDLSNYLTNVQPTLLVQVNPVGDTTHFGKWQHTVVAYDSVEVSGSSGKWMESAAKWEAIANATDGLGSTLSPVQFSLLNAVSTAY